MRHRECEASFHGLPRVAVMLVYAYFFVAGSTEIASASV
jgi:hypothetical protein